MDEIKKLNLIPTQISGNRVVLSHEVLTNLVNCINEVISTVNEIIEQDDSLEERLSQTQINLQALATAIEIIQEE